MSHVYISYQNADSDFAGFLMLQLERAGIDTWMDKERLRPGYDWSEDIDQAIQDAFAMVLIMSPDAKASEYVTYEWGYAIGAGIRVIPVLIRDTPLHPRLARIQYLNFTAPSLRPWNALVQALQEIQGDVAILHLPRSTPAYIKRAIAALDSANPDERRGGVACLADAPEPIVRDVLAHAMKHPLLDVRGNATIALAKAGDQRALPGVEEALMSQDIWFKEEVEAICRLGTPILPILYNILATSSTYDQPKKIAVEAIHELVSPDAASSLANFLVRFFDTVKQTNNNSGLPDSICLAADTLASLTDCMGIERLAGYLSSPHPAVRILIIQMIGKLRCPDYILPLSQLLQDDATGTIWCRFDSGGGGYSKRSSVRSCAEEALKNIDTPEARAALRHSPSDAEQ